MNLLTGITQPFIFHISGVLLALLILILSIRLLFYPLILSKIKNQALSVAFIGLTIMLGLYMRLSLAWYSPGNYDLTSYDIVSNLVLSKQNVYAQTVRYNYSPIWFYLLALFKIIANVFRLPFPFIVRSFLTLVDLAIALVLTKIARLKKINPFIVVIAFFLNPISILLTGHHGQFENLSMLLIIIGIYVYLKYNKKVVSAWIFILSGGIVKHLAFNQVIAYISYIAKSKIKTIVLSTISIVIFLLTFVPFWKEGGQSIINNVFLYKSYEGFYGIYTFIKSWHFIAEFYRWLFALGFFIFALVFKHKDLGKTILINSLFFLTFASGMADQYYVLPVALGALYGSLPFYLYTLIVGLFLFKSSAQLNQGQYAFITDKIVWLVVAFWFVSELIKTRPLNRNAKK